MPKRGKLIFTETWIRNLKPPPTGFTPFKESGRRGFLLRVYAGGSKVFFYQYSWRGKAEFLKLREWLPDMGALAHAHKEHAAALDLYIRGVNPRDEREREAKAQEVREQHEKTVRGVGIRNVIAEWAWHYARRNRKNPREAVRLLKVYLGQPWKGRPAGELRRRDGVLLLDRIVARGSNVMANRVHALGWQAFNFCVGRDLIAVNPFVGVPKPGGEESSKERSLDRAEIRSFWKGLEAPDTAISQQVRLGLKLILVTAQRPGEISTARFEDIDLERRIWTIPAAIAKNGKEHYVPLSDLAVELIEALRTLAKGRPHLLPSQQSKLKREEPISERALSRALRNNHANDEDPKLFGIEPFTPHDLRRTAATNITALGIPRLHVLKLLNHSDRETTAIYDRHHYWTEKQRALELWDAELRTIIAGKKSKVVSLQREQVA